MIKRMSTEQLELVMELWLNSNLEAHAFLEPCYWHDHYDAVKAALPQSDLFVYEEGGEVRGFVGIVNEGYIAGLFVGSQWRSKGIGEKLLCHCKERYGRLELNVYVKNNRAMLFYERQGFHKKAVQNNPDSGEEEAFMLWIASS